MDSTLSNALLVAAAAGLTDAELASVVEAATVARRNQVAAPGLVPMVHPAVSGREMWVDVDAVPVYEASGWAVAEEPTGEPDESAEPAVSGDPPDETPADENEVTP